MIEFSIILLTYNRHELLQHTLRSLSLQTYKKFKVLLIDNGSYPPVDPSILPSDLDICFVRYEKNEHGCDIQNDAIEKVDGTHFLWLADDDVLTPGTLEIVAGIFSENSKVKSIGVGFSRYDLVNNVPLHNKAYFETFTGRLERFDAFNTGIAYCRSWYIGPKVNIELPRMAHASASFFDMEMIRETIDSQGELFVKPFGDVGFVGTCFHQKYIHYLDLPLVVLGESRVKEMNGSLPGQRMKWLREIPFIEFSPLKACSFANMGVESHLKVLYRNGINKLVDCSLRSDFFMGHLQQVASDNPWKETTERDIEEAIPFAIAALQKEKYNNHSVAEIETSVRNWISDKKREYHKDNK